MFQANHQFASPSYGNPVVPDTSTTPASSEHPASSSSAMQPDTERDFAHSSARGVVDTANEGGASNALPTTALLNNPGMLEQALAGQQGDSLRTDEPHKPAGSSSPEAGLLHRPPIPQQTHSTDGTDEYRTKPTLGDKIAGTIDQIKGTVTGNRGLKEEGKLRKQGEFSDALDHF